MMAFTEKYLAAHGRAMFKVNKPRPKVETRSDTEGSANSQKASLLSSQKQQALKEGKFFMWTERTLGS